MRLTVAEKSGDMSARFVGECREVVDDDHVSVGRCAGDALQLGVVDRLTDTNLRHNHKHALACPTAEGGLVFFNDFCYTICLNTCRTDPRRIFRIGSQTEVSFFRSLSKKVAMTTNFSWHCPHIIELQPDNSVSEFRLYSPDRRR